MKRLILIGVTVMAVANNEILSLIILCILGFAGIVKLFGAMADNGIDW